MVSTKPSTRPWEDPAFSRAERERGVMHVVQGPKYPRNNECPARRAPIPQVDVELMWCSCFIRRLARLHPLWRAGQEYTRGRVESVFLSQCLQTSGALSIAQPRTPAPPRVCARRWARAGERAGAAQDQILKLHVLVSVTELAVSTIFRGGRARARRRCGSVTSHHGKAGSGRRRHGCSGRCAAV